MTKKNESETAERFNELCRRWESGETLTPQELADMTQYQMEQMQIEKAKAARAAEIDFDNGEVSNEIH